MLFKVIIPFSLAVMSVYNATNSSAGVQPVANLVCKTNGGGVRPDYCLYIAQYLREIGIQIEVKVEEWTVFVGTLIVARDFDIGVVSLSGGGASPDMYDIYSEDGSLIIFGMDTEMHTEMTLSNTTAILMQQSNG